MFWQIILVLVLLIPIMAVVLDSQVGKALATRLEGRGLGRGSGPESDRVALLEGEVERLSSELRRLDEESRFLHELLTERPSQGRTLGSGEVQE